MENYKYVLSSVLLKTELGHGERRYYQKHETEVSKNATSLERRY